jgi:hypothetical protein
MVEDIHVNIVKSLIMFGRRGRITTSLGDEIKIDHLFRHLVFSSESDASSETHVLILSDPLSNHFEHVEGNQRSLGSSLILRKPLISYLIASFWTSMRGEEHDRESILGLT